MQQRRSLGDDRPSDRASESSGAASSAFERLGGEARLRPIIDTFVDRVVNDVMIGFFFRSVDLERLKQFEYEFAAAHLGGPSNYSGRPLARAHAQHPILGGHFNRRLRILEKTLADFSAPEDVIREWIEHNERLRRVITRDLGTECILPTSPSSSAPSGEPR